MARLTNPMKNEIGGKSKVILENINLELRIKMQTLNSNNTRAVINWFKKTENRNKYIFMIFDIKDFYSSISKKLFDDFINFARQHKPVGAYDGAEIVGLFLLNNLPSKFGKKSAGLYRDDRLALF